MPGTLAEPSPWICRFAPLVGPGARVLDVAAGRGRNGRHFLARGHRVTFVDIDTGGLADLEGRTGVDVIEADLEAAGPWPFVAGSFDAILIANYLHRPHTPHYLASLAPGGVLLHETFAAGNADYGRPRNPDFLLRPGELPELYGARLHVVAYEHGLDAGPPPAMRQRIACVDLEGPLPIPPPDGG